MRGRPKKNRRRTGFQDQRKVVRVLAEGEVTEPAYLRCMAKKEVRLDIGRTAGFVPMSLVKQARKEVRANRKARDGGFDEIWCVFDQDEHPNVAQAIREARDSGIGTALSNPCFELWLVLHVEERTGHIERDAAQARCQDLGLTAGKALADGTESRLVEGYVEAKRRAQALDRMHEASGSARESNPSSNVWQLVDRLKNQT